MSFFTPLTVTTSFEADHIPYNAVYSQPSYLLPAQLQVLAVYSVIIMLLSAGIVYLLGIKNQRDKQLQLKEQQLTQQQSQMERTVKQRTAKLEAFAYSVSHDLRTPLRTINGFSQLLLGDKTINLHKASQEKLQRIINASQNMGQLIDGLLNFYRISNVSLNSQMLNLNRLAEESFTQLQFNEPARQIELVTLEAPTCKGDPTLMRAVLDNLVGNAWKYTQPIDDALIEFGATTTGTTTTYYIKDNGIGFNMEFASKLFKPFNRLHEDEDEIEGTGIGLAIVYEIITRHNGRIWAKSSQGSDHGTTVYFTVNEVIK